MVSKLRQFCQFNHDKVGSDFAMWLKNVSRLRDLVFIETPQYCGDGVCPNDKMIIA